MFRVVHHPEVFLKSGPSKILLNRLHCTKVHSTASRGGWAVHTLAVWIICKRVFCDATGVLALDSWVLGSPLQHLY